MAPQHQQITITRGMDELPTVCEAVARFCRDIAATQKDAHSLHLAVEEAVSNVLQHGYQGEAHPVTLWIEAIPPDRVRAVVTDHASAYDPLARPEVDTNMPLEERQIGGLGVHLVKKLMNVTRYERRDGMNILTMELMLGQ